MWLSLLVASAMVVTTVTIHFAGLYGLSRVLETRGARFRPQSNPWGMATLVIFMVLALFALHTVQIWLYAGVYALLGEFRTFEEALYFSTVTFSTVGFGDIVQESEWRLVGAIESANGFLLIGWSTAFLVSVVTRIRHVRLPWLSEDSGS